MRGPTLLFALLALHILALGCDSTAPAPEGTRSSTTLLSEEASAWLNANVHPLTTFSPSADYADLEPLRDIVGEARVVSLGESTYGTHQFFTMKHRILRYLVEEMGFTAFAIEATMPEAFLVDEYVRHGTGDPAQRLAGLYVWNRNTREMLDQVQWMRAYNAAHTSGVGFYGFDVQHPSLAIEVVEEYLTRLDPDAAAIARARYDCFRSFAEGNGRLGDYPFASLTTISTCRTGVMGVLKLLDEQADELTARSSAKAFSFARRHARLVVQAEIFHAGNPGVRDVAMAENILWLLGWLGPDAKIVVWAHNQHVSENYPPYESMGYYLASVLGDDHMSIGFSFHQGSVSAWQRLSSGNIGAPAAMIVPPPPFTGPEIDQYYENYLITADATQWLLDLRPVRPGTPGAEWLFEPLRTRQIRSVYDPEAPNDFFYRTLLPVEYDALIHFDRARSSTLLPLPDAKANGSLPYLAPKE